MRAAIEPEPDRSPVLTHTESAMGTVFSLTLVPGEVAEPRLRSAVGSACATLHQADATFSTWDPQSPVSRLRRGAAALAELPPEVAQVLQLCGVARQLSGGWFDPWAMPGGVDPTGLVKGWAVDRALAVLQQAGLAAAMVNGGGDLAAFGSPAPGQRWRAGIRHPWCAGILAGIVEIEAAVATSGPYERGVHFVEPATGRQVCRAASATVTGPSLAMADALATALAVGGDQALAIVEAAEGYAAYLIRPDGSETSTAGITFVS